MGQIMTVLDSTDANVYITAESSPRQDQKQGTRNRGRIPDILVHPLCPSRSEPRSNHTGVDAQCNFSPLAQRLDRVAIYEEFLRLTKNGTQLQNFILDRNSVLVDGKAPWSLGQKWGLPISSPGDFPGNLETLGWVSTEPSQAGRRCILPQILPTTEGEERTFSGI